MLSYYVLTLTVLLLKKKKSGISSGKMRELAVGHGPHCKSTIVAYLEPLRKRNCPASLRQ